MNKIIDLARISANTAESVVSPFRPSRKPDPVSWRNSDQYQLPRAKVEQIKRAPAANRPKMKYEPRRTPPPAPPSKWKAALSTVGGLAVSVGVIGGLLSIVALGPIGIAVAVGAGVIGAALIRAGAK